MSSNNQIRIVKRAEREQQAEELEAKQLESANETPQEKDRDTALTVTGWIVEQQEEQSTGGARADFEKLFGESR